MLTVDWQTRTRLKKVMEVVHGMLSATAGALRRYYSSA